MEKRDDETLVEFFKELERAEIISNVANLENFFNLLPSEKKIYLGIDCTSDSLHIGHLFLFFQTLRFIKRGFKLILLLGGFTSRVGDPTDKKKERILIKENDVDFFTNKIKEQIERIFFSSFNFSLFNEYSPLEKFYSNDKVLLKRLHLLFDINESDDKEVQWRKYINFIFPINEFKNKNVEIINNKNWFSKLNIFDFFFTTGKNISINYLLSKDWIKERKKNGVSYFSFNYPLFQAYDFYYLYKEYACFGQLGGSDQWGNITTGLKLIRGHYPDSKPFAFNFKLLTNKKGEKISKSASNSKILLSNLNNDWFDFFNNMEDEIAKIYLKQFTFISEEKLNYIFKLNNPNKLRIPQRILFELISVLNFRNFFIKV